MGRVLTVCKQYYIVCVCTHAHVQYINVYCVWYTLFCTLCTAPIFPQLSQTSDCAWSCTVTGHCTTVSSTHPTPQPSEWKHMCVSMQCEHACTCMHVQYVHAYIHVLYVRRYVRMCKHMYVRMCICTSIHTVHTVCTVSVY